MRSKLLVAAAVLATAALFLHDETLSAQAARIALVGGTIYVNPTDAPIRNGVVLVEAGRITAVGPRRSIRIPPGTNVIDTSGGTITAGFSGEVAGPRIRSTGEAIFPRGGAGEPSTAQAAWAALGFMPLDRFQTARVVDAPEARAAATKLLETGTDGLKLYAVTIGRNGISSTGPTIEALVEEAHRRQKPVFCE